MGLNRMKQIKRNMKAQGIVCALAVAVMAATGCIKENLMGEGAPISFGVSTGYGLSTGTRTEYSGEIVGTSPRYERIDWVQGTDRIRILCDEASVAGAERHYADYLVTEATSTTGQQKSTATVKPVAIEGGTANGLCWGASSDHYFYALYPAATMSGVTASEAVLASASGHKAIVTGKIPAIQEVTLSGREYKPDMNYAYMYAAATVTPSSTARVTLPFKPLMTAMEFTLVSSSEYPMDSKLTSAKLTSGSTSLSGTFEATLSASADPSVEVSDAGSSLTITFPDGGILLSQTDPVKFTFLAIPKDQTDLRLTLSFADGRERTLALKEQGSPISVPAGNKTYFNNLSVPGVLTTYTLGTVADLVKAGHAAGSVTSAAFASYKTSLTGVTTALDLAVEYASANPDGTCAEDWSSTVPAGLSDVMLTSSGNNKTFSASIAAQTVLDDQEIVDEKAIHSANLMAAPVVSTPRDLSLTDVNGQVRTSNPVTANSYVVKAAGWYMFPLVYGNAIDYTKVADDVSGNVTAYFPNRTPYSGSHLMQRFQNCNGDGITSPYILSDLGLTASTQLDAVVVWQDVESGKDLVSSLSIEEAPSGGLPCKYIKFQVPADNLCQGNVVIALRDVSGGNTPATAKILWSWHIWITDEDLAAQNAWGMGMMPFDLGWCSGYVYTTNTYAPRSWWVRLTQAESGRTETFRITQTSDVEYILSGGSSSPYYQWGRKDPFLRSNGGDTNAESSSPAGYTIVDGTAGVSSGTATAANAGESIRNPHVFLFALATSGSDWSWMNGFYPRNLWNALLALTTNEMPREPEYGYNAIKTVYDPCPPGFHVANISTYVNFMKSPSPMPTANVTNINAVDLNGNGVLDGGDFSYNPAHPDYAFQWSARGWHFKKSDTDTQGIYFRTQGFRGASSSTLSSVGWYGYQWMAVTPGIGQACAAHFTYNSGTATSNYYASQGATVRPMAE